MTHELALLAALFKPHMQCTWTEPGKAPVRFHSDNMATPSGSLLYQRNYGTGFDEIIVYAYDTAHKRYVRSQLSSDGAEASAQSAGPVNGIWRLTGLHAKGAISWKRTGDVSRYWYDGVRGMGVCR